MKEDLNEIQNYFQEATHRFAGYFVTMAEEAEVEMTGPHHADWIVRLDAEFENLRSVLLWAIRYAQAEQGLRLAGALRRYWTVRDRFQESYQLLDELLCSVDTSHHTIAKIKTLWAAAELAQKLGDLVTTRALRTESLELSRKLDYQIGVAGSLLHLGALLLMENDYLAAISLLEESLSIWRTLNNQSGITIVLHNLGMCYHSSGDYDSARKAFEESLAISRTLKYALHSANTLEHLGNLSEEQGDYAAARAAFIESLLIRQQFGDILGIAESLESFVALAVAQSQYKKALQLAGLAAALRESMHTPLLLFDQRRYATLLAQARQGLGNVAANRALKTGRMMTIQQGIEYALAASVAISHES
jgi:tetratricopeptide (TPR) repeat protein